ncbi:MAG TPA: hypothetical protein VJZ71_06555 [Phycisphaerae bacterium]|nr:hypothetical protein [Phycisphaerae bacterium]
MRRLLTEKSLAAARAWATIMPAGPLPVVEWVVARLARHLPRLSAHVRSNMRAAGVWSEPVFRAYFEQVALHLGNSARIFKWADKQEALARLIDDQVQIDPSVGQLRDALNAGKGAVVAAPHVCNYVFTLARLNREVPLTVYLRWSPNQHKLDMKRRWCEAVGLPVILEPPDQSNPTSRAAACVDALRSGRALVMTPDIAQKDRDKGVGVQILGHSACLPVGPASIAMLAEAPIVPVFGRLSGKTHVIYASAPLYVSPRTRAEGGRNEALRVVMQQWAEQFTAFVRACPQAWFLWGDSRWTRVFRGDPRYAVPETPKSQIPKKSKQEAEGVA